MHEFDNTQLEIEEDQPKPWYKRLFGNDNPRFRRIVKVNVCLWEGTYDVVTFEGLFAEQLALEYVQMKRRQDEN